jgi:AbrB family looped-hinge helix DNA binding protein
MSKVTSKLQVTIPKAVAETHGIRPGSEIIFESAGDTILVHQTATSHESAADQAAEVEFRLRLFDEASARQKSRAESQMTINGKDSGRGWTREELYP